MVTSLFEVSSVSYRYPDGRPGLSEMSLSVAERESLVILGANASGKSTLISLLGGLAFPTSGSVRAFGAELTESALEDGDYARAFRRRVGVLLQDTDAMLFNPTVYDELAFGPLQLDLSPGQVRQRVEDILQLLNLHSVSQQPPHLLSGGEQRKVALGAILSTSPDVLLLDEPTAGLDPRFQRWFVEFAVELRRLGKTLVIATHDLHIVEEVGDRVMVLGEDHRMAAVASPHEILIDLDLLLSVNLVHEHTHVHDGELHIHPHAHLHADHHS
jgi:cobalt/nickel transport system ATP-binding protein